MDYNYKRKYFCLRSDYRKLKKETQSLADSVLLFVHYLDIVIGPQIPRLMGGKLAEATNKLDMKNDVVRYGVLGVDFRRDDKGKVIKKLREKKT
jgi:hypothetical protein